MEPFINLGLAIVPPALAFLAGLLLHRKPRVLLLAMMSLLGLYVIAMVVAVVAAVNDPTYQTSVADRGFPILASLIVALALMQAGINIGRRLQT